MAKLLGVWAGQWNNETLMGVSGERGSSILLHWRWFFPNSTQQEENLGVSDEKLGVFDNKIGVSDEKLGVFDNKIGVSDEKLGVSEEKLGIFW